MEIALSRADYSTPITEGIQAALDKCRLIHREKIAILLQHHAKPVGQRWLAPFVDLHARISETSRELSRAMAAADPNYWKRNLRSELSEILGGDDE